MRKNSIPGGAFLTSHSSGVTVVHADSAAIVSRAIGGATITPANDLSGGVGPLANVAVRTIKNGEFFLLFVFLWN